MKSGPVKERIYDQAKVSRAEHTRTLAVSHSGARSVLCLALTRPALTCARAGDLRHAGRVQEWRDRGALQHLGAEVSVNLTVRTKQGLDLTPSRVGVGRHILDSECSRPQGLKLRAQACTVREVPYFLTTSAPEEGALDHCARVQRKL